MSQRKPKTPAKASELPTLQFKRTDLKAEATEQSVTVAPTTLDVVIIPARLARKLEAFYQGPNVGKPTPSGVRKRNA